MKIGDDFLRYFRSVTGQDLKAVPMPADKARGLPLYLRSYYDIFEAEILDHDLLCAVQKSNTEPATPSEYAGHYDKLCAILKQDIAMVLPQLASYSRQQLVRLRVPFIVTGRQMFLPMLVTDLRERFPRLTQARPRRLSAAAQVVLLRHLLGHAAENMALRDLAADLGYSAMTLSNVRQELEHAKLCRTIRRGRQALLVFDKSKQDLWKQAEPLLRDPVRSRCWIQRLQPAQNLMKAGLTALADLSMVSDDDIPTYAVNYADCREQTASGEITICPGPEEARARLECWRYDPQLMTNGKTVDRLSLFLSLRQTGDERVAQALKELMEGVAW